MVRSLFVSSLAALVLAPFVAAQTIVYNAAALPAQNIWTDGVLIIDVDHDGDNDIVFGNGNVYGGVGAAGAQPQQLFLNNGAGVFADGSPMLNVANFNAKMVIGANFDGDAGNWPDLVFSSGSTGSPPRFLRNKGEIAGVWQGFVDETVTRIPALALRSFCVVAGDVDDDGDLDLAVNDGGTFGGIASQARLLLNNGAGVFTDVTAAQMPADLYNCQDITLLDFDGDYDLDMALSGKGAGGLQGRLYLNNGAGTFSVNTVMNLVGSGLTYEVDWGDIDGDADFDSAVQSISSASEGWARNDGTASPMFKTTFSGTNGGDDNEMALMDFDNDGDQDVFVGSLATSEKVYRNTGGVLSFAANVISAQADSTLDFAIGDLNNDHRYDLVTGQGESGSFLDKVYMNSGATDTIPPLFLRKDTPAAIGASGTVFHAQVRDSVSDDGVISATMEFCWATAGAGAAVGHGTALHQGEGQFRALVPTTAGTTGVSLWWVATDWSGNKSFTGPVDVGTPPASAWADIGFALAGTAGPPVLSGTGILDGDCPASLDLSNAAPSAPALMFVSISSTPVGFKGGTLAAFPFLSTLGAATSAGGTLSLSFLWPTGIPSGFNLFAQWAIQDAGGPAGAALSNCVQGTTP